MQYTEGNGMGAKRAVVRESGDFSQWETGVWSATLECRDRIET